MPVKAIQSAIFSVGLLSCSLPLLADVTLVTTVQTKQVTESGTKTDAETYTLSIKGRKARRQSASGSVLLIDRDANQAYYLDPETKTYWSVTIREAMDRGSRLQGDIAGFMTIHADMDLKQGKIDGSESLRDVDGFATRLLTLSGDASLSPKLPDTPVDGNGRPGGFPGGGPPVAFPGGGGRGFPGGGGGFPGSGPPSGGFPRGGQPSGGNLPFPDQGPESPKMAANGEIYVTDAMGLLGVSKRDAVELTYPLVQALLPEDNPLTKVLSNRLGRRAPLAGTITVVLPAPPESPKQTRDADAASPDHPHNIPADQPGAPRDAGSAPPAGPPPLPPERKTQTLVITLTTGHIDSSADLDDALFAIPADYRKVDPPTPKIAFALPPMRPRPTTGGNATVYAGDRP